MDPLNDKALMRGTRPVFAVLNRTIPLRHIPVCARCGAARCEHTDHDWSGTPTK